MSPSIRSALARVLAAAALGWAAAPGPAFAQPTPPPPSSAGVCPDIEEDGTLCAADLASGNCEDFVSAAGRLGALYRGEVADLPDSQEASLLTTNWWGCGPNSLNDVKILLLRIGTPHALAVLQQPPYPMLPGPPPPAPPPPGLVNPPLVCDELASPTERNACIGVRLQAARADHQRVLERCQALVAPGLREDLTDDEQRFKAMLPVRCDAQGAGMDDKSMQAFVRSRCLVQALTENTRGILDAHPECAAGN